jgi:hypothetical protein
MGHRVTVCCLLDRRFAEFDSALMIKSLTERRKDLHWALHRIKMRLVPSEST